MKPARTTRWSLRPLTALILATGLMLTQPAAGQDEPADGPAGKIKALNQEAVSAFEGYSFKRARQKLHRALTVAEGAHHVPGPLLARTYLLLGLAYVSGSNDLYRGLHYFVRALRLHRKIAIPKALATPQLHKVFKEAKKTLKRVGKPPVIALKAVKKKHSPSATGTRKTGRGLVHSPIDFAKRGYPIPVKAAAGLDIQAHKVFLFFRPSGTVKYQRAPMKKSGRVFRGEIPSRATQKRILHYYIEAQDQRGRLAGSNGSAPSPNVVIIN
jgi:hypothetical protein